MILVDTSIIVAWLDPDHPHHNARWSAIRVHGQLDDLAVSAVTFAELAAGARTRDAVEEALKGFVRLDLDFASAWRAGQTFRRYHPGKTDRPVLPDFFIRAQAATHNLQHLTNDRRRLSVWPDVDFVFPER